jgi:hypothetical protein
LSLDGQRRSPTIHIQCQQIEFQMDCRRRQSRQPNEYLASPAHGARNRPDGSCAALAPLPSEIRFDQSAQRRSRFFGVNELLTADGRQPPGNATIRNKAFSSIRPASPSE